jgi:hypothetical protein
MMIAKLLLDSFPKHFLYFLALIAGDC